MKLLNVLKDIPYELTSGSLDIEINDISYDSRNIDKNMIYVALVGIDNDGHDYINDALNKGCTCLIIMKDIEVNNHDITIIKVSDTRKYLANMSANIFDNPGDKLIKIAITGTKGKTSISYMLKNILEFSGYRVGVIGSNGTIIGNKNYPHKNTTPESYLIQKYMRMMVDCGVTHLIMEASSQALKVGRISNIFFEYGIFTNLSIDHVGQREHPTYEDYVTSKAMLFRKCKYGILNKDDQEYYNMTKSATCKIYTYGKDNCDLSIKSQLPINEPNFLGTEFSCYGLTDDIFKISTPGEFSVYNATSAIATCKLLNIDNKYIKLGLENFSVDGRCEVINIHNKTKVIIDYAHNKISMESIINTMKKYSPHRIITIFGCGGGRSYDRRYELGVVSGSLSDLSIVTTDNPRNDNLDDINRDIVAGIKSINGNYLVIKDREEAIIYALNNAQENDIILLLGKGHEKYQDIKGEKHPFDEKEIINNYLTNK